MCPSPKQSTRDWIQIPREIGWARPVCHPLGKLSAPRMGARGAIWAHIQIIFYHSILKGWHSKQMILYWPTLMPRQKYCYICASKRIRIQRRDQ